MAGSSGQFSMDMDMLNSTQADKGLPIIDFKVAEKDTAF